MSSKTMEALGNGQIRTYSGRTISPLNPDPGDIDIVDIAHALSLNCRFTGHTKWHYSVAQHSVLVASLVEPELALTALLHDASEAYLSDIARPIKQQPEFGSVYVAYEAKLEAAIGERFALAYPFPKAVKTADTIALATEMRDLMNGPKADYPTTTLDDVSIERLHPWEAEELFLEHYEELS